MKTDKNINYVLFFSIICVVILILSIGYYFIVNCWQNNERGSFGDLFGGLNAIFSGFAFAGVIITILMQMKELELTREELKKSSNAQDRSQTALFKQLESMEKSSMIDSVNKMIEIFADDKDLDKELTAKAILKKMTSDIFDRDEFKHILTPKIKLLSSKVENNVQNQKFDIKQAHVVQTIIENDGIAFQIEGNILSRQDKTYRVRFLRINEKVNSVGELKTTFTPLPSKNFVERNAKIQITIHNVTEEKSLELELIATGDHKKTVKKAYFNYSLNEKMVDVEIYNERQSSPSI